MALIFLQKKEDVMKVYNVKVEAKMQFHFPIVARNSAEAEKIVHELCGVNGAEDWN